MKYTLTLHSHFDKGVTTYLHDPFQYEQFILHQAGEQTLHCGRCTIASGGDFEIGTLLSSTGDVHLDGHERLQIHDLILLPPNTEAPLQVRGEARYAFVRFSLNDVASAQSFSIMKQINRIFVTPKQAMGAGNGETLHLLLHEAMQQSLYTHLLIGSYLNQLLVAVSRHLLQADRTNELSVVGESDHRVHTRKDIAQQALLYIDNQYMELRDLREVAARIGYSYSYVSHVFREEVGVSLQSYYTNKKIKRAMQMLAKNRQSVTRVAEQLQYQSIHSFSKAFKKFTGLTPTEFQQQYDRSKITI